MISRTTNEAAVPEGDRGRSPCTKTRLNTMTNGRRTDGVINEASALEEAGHLREALSKWREVIAQEATAVSLCRFGRVAAQLKEWREAEQALHAAIAAAPEWSLPLEVLALVYRDQGALEKAEGYLRRSLSSEKKARTLTLLGDVLQRQGKTAEAKAALEAAIRLDDSYEEAYFLLAQANRDDPQKAMPLYRRAIDLDPSYGPAHRELGWVLRRLNLLDDAADHVRRAIDADYNDSWPLIYLGNILWAKEDIQGAEVAFRRATAIDPSSAVAYWCLADLMKSQGRLQEARRLLRLSLRANVNSVEANLRFALLLRDVGELRKANRYLQRVLRLEPTNRVARSLLGLPVERPFESDGPPSA